MSRRRYLSKPIECPRLASVRQFPHTLKREPALASPNQALDRPGDILAATLIRVDHLSYLRCYRPDGIILMRLPPPRKHLNHALTCRVAFLDLPDAVHRVGTTEGEQWIAHPYPPVFETTERDAALHSALATPSPYREGGS